MNLVLSVGLGTLTLGASACFFWLNEEKKRGGGDLPNTHISLANCLTLVDIKKNKLGVKMFQNLLLFKSKVEEVMKKSAVALQIRFRQLGLN